MKLFSFIITILVILAAMIFGMNNLLSVDDLVNCEHPDASKPKCQTGDAIIAISGGDTTARTAHAVELYKDGWATKIVFSGAALDPQSPSNAMAMRLQALNAGVPDHAIILEENSQDTAANAFNTKRLLGQNARRVILVTSPYHQRRASIEFEKVFGKQTQIVNSPAKTDRLWSDTWWLSMSGWWLAISEGVKTVIAMAK